MNSGLQTVSFYINVKDVVKKLVIRHFELTAVFDSVSEG